MIALLAGYLPLLGLTLAIEAPVIAAAAPRRHRRATLAFCVALNLVTHPIATLLSWRFGADVLVLEAAVILAEWLGYELLAGLRTGAALRCAVLANLASALAGVVILTALSSR